MYKYIRTLPLLAFLMLMLNNSCKKESPNTTTIDRIPPMDSFVGSYHVMGGWYGVGSVGGSGNIDGIIFVSKYNDSTLVVTGSGTGLNLSGNPMGYEATSTYLFWVGGGDNWEQVVFRKPYNDSIFYTSKYGFASGYEAVQCQGEKIH
jgi:hypothetical protein